VIKIEVTAIGDTDTPKEALRRLLEAEAQKRANHGWTVRAQVSRGGSVYTTYAKKLKSNGKEMRRVQEGD
jgi:hypothetical protein